METTERQAAGPVFHFSDAPTVTTGFLAFVFDIRRDRSRAGLSVQNLEAEALDLGSVNWHS